MTEENLPEHDENAHDLVGADTVEAPADFDLADALPGDPYGDAEVDAEPDEEPFAGASWRAAACISALIRDLDKAFPNRVTPDWVVGDPAHSARVSDHNPDSRGIVHAIDIRLGGDLDPQRVLKAVIGDPRTQYVIHDGVITSRTYDWRPRPYTGSNPHKTHIHVSVRYSVAAENDTSEWGVVKVMAPVVDLSVVRRQFRIALDLTEGEVEVRPSVRRVQMALNRKVGADLTTDGIVGKQTIAAFKKWESRKDVPGTGRQAVPDAKSLRPLVQPKWKMVP